MPRLCVRASRGSRYVSSHLIKREGDCSDQVRGAQQQRSPFRLSAIDSSEISPCQTFSWSSAPITATTVSAPANVRAVLPIGGLLVLVLGIAPRGLMTLCANAVVKHWRLDVTLTLSTWLVILLAVAAANLPFVSQRLMGVLSMSRPKTLPIRLVELLACYLVAGGAGLALEQRAGRVAAQGWEFYAITGALFLTLAFPGFVWRYLMKHRNG